MGDDDEGEAFIGHLPMDNVDHDANDQIVQQQILDGFVVEPEIDDAVVPVQFGEAQLVNYNPINLQNHIQPPWGFNFDFNGDQPMEIRLDIVHPNDEGGLETDTINDLIVYNDQIEFAPTVFVAFPDHPVGDDDDNEIVFAEEIVEEPVPIAPIDETINEVLTLEPMEIDDPFVHDANNPVAGVTTNEMDENVTMPTVLPTGTETPPTAAAVIVVEEASPNNVETPTPEAQNQVADQRIIAREPAATTAIVNNAVGAIALPAPSPNHHRSKSTESGHKIPSNEGLLEQRSRSRTLS